MSVGSFNGFEGGPNSLSDPGSVTFDSNAGVAFGYGKSDPSSPQHNTDLSLSWRHQLKPGGNFGISFSNTNGKGAPLFSPVNAASLPSSYFPPGYFAAVQQRFQSPSGCNTTRSFEPSDLYLDSSISGLRQLEQQTALTGTFVLRKDLVLQAGYAIDVDKLASHDPRLHNAYSVTIFGAQLDGHPLHSGNAVLDYKPHRSAIEWLMDANYTSVNNWANLPSFVTVDAGASATLDHGTLVLAMSNIFGAYPGLFATPTGVPLPTAGGRPLPTIAQPIGPRRLTITYSVKLGQSVPMH